MGKYTIIDNEEIDSKIENDLNYIVREICNVLRPISIILTGSFGRGEGTVIYHKGTIQVPSDYEICIVSKDLKTRKICAELSDKISEKLNIETSISWISPERLKNNKKNNISKGYSYPSIFMYELKTGSKVLYGKNLLDENIIDSEDIILWEGIKLLFNRMVESFIIIQQENPNTFNKEKWLNKTLLACGDILLLYSKKYNYSYSERMKRLSLNMNEYPFLKKNDLQCLIKAYEAKLNADYSKYNEYNINEIYELVDNILRFSLDHEMFLKFDNYKCFSEKYINKKENFYKFYTFNFYSIINPLFENIIYLIKLISWGNLPNIRIIKYINIPFHHLVYSIIPPIYFFENLKNEEKDKIINFANEILYVFNETQSKNINEIRKGILKIWFRICFGKNA